MAASILVMGVLGGNLYSDELNPRVVVDDGCLRHNSRNTMNPILTSVYDEEFLSALTADIASYQDSAWGGFGQPPGANDIYDTYMSIGALVMLQGLELCRESHRNASRKINREDTGKSI